MGNIRQTEYPKCEQKDCFASHYGRCQCLISTKFKRQCPFYKKRKMPAVGTTRPGEII